MPLVGPLYFTVYFVLCFDFVFDLQFKHTLEFALLLTSGLKILELWSKLWCKSLHQ